jgi:acyl-CoA synthetase (NDP forming)
VGRIKPIVAVKSGRSAAGSRAAEGLEIPPPGKATHERLRGFLPEAAGVTNPADMIATATAERTARRSGSRRRRAGGDLHPAPRDPARGRRALDRLLEDRRGRLR